MHMHTYTDIHTNSPTITPPSLSYFLFPSGFSVLSLRLEKLFTCGVIRSYNLGCWLPMLHVREARHQFLVNLGRMASHDDPCRTRTQQLLHTWVRQQGTLRELDVDVNEVHKIKTWPAPVDPVVDQGQGWLKWRFQPVRLDGM